MLVSVENAEFSYGGNLIFKDVNFSVNESERVALIGANGEGKTTLLKIICGRLEADSGRVLRRSGIKIGYLEQNGGYVSGNTVYGEILSVLSADISAIKKYESLSVKISQTEYGTREYAALSAQIETLQKFISAHDSFNAEVKIKTVLNGMGFKNSYDRIIDTMSGGEKTRLKLARLLLEEPDLLILDEPTNHLDIPTLFWLEEYMRTFKGAAIVVSHDRYFLDRLCTRTFEIENKKLLCFNGNYTKYKTLKSEYTARLLKEYEALCEERAKLQDYVDRNIVRATTAKSALSRVNRLERMEIPEKPYVPPAPPKFCFEYDETPYENVLEIDGLNLEIGGKRLISRGQAQIKRGEKVALVGKNGTGKTTLIKHILHGGDFSITVGRRVKFAYYDQEGANLDGGNTVLYELWSRRSSLTQTEVRSALARCGIFREDVGKKVNSLSGGERAKLALCILESERGNVLLLDEPTNHLDLPARESLETALKNFDGTVIFVSHDRYFLSALAQKVLEIEDGKLKTYDGGYDYYIEQKRQDELNNRAEVQLTNNAVTGYRSKKQRAESVRENERKKRIEAEISAAEEEENSINSMLSQPEITADYKRVRELSERLKTLRERLDGLYGEYGELID